MKYDLFGALILLKDTGSDNEILLCDTGDGWTLPFGPIGVGQPTLEMQEMDAESEALISCLTHLVDQANIGPELIEDGEVIQSRLWFVESEENTKEACLVYYAFVDQEQQEALEKALDEKKGNARFFKYDHAHPDLPELAHEWMYEAIKNQMQYFNKRQN